MVVPWAHGFKSIKWLQSVVLTNKYEANDTYALQNNDPESYLKTAAYFDTAKETSVAVGRPVVFRGTAMVGWPGLDRVEYWLRPRAEADPALADDDPAWGRAVWTPGTIDRPPADWGGDLPNGVLPKDVWGFDASGKPKEWPLRFSIAHWTVVITDVKPGRYELRVRTVDKNGFAQPEPRPNQKSGQNRVAARNRAHDIDPTRFTPVILRAWFTVWAVAVALLILFVLLRIPRGTAHRLLSQPHRDSWCLAAAFEGRYQQWRNDACRIAQFVPPVKPSTYRPGRLQHGRRAFRLEVSRSNRSTHNRFGTAGA
jgi:hypothetical protein